MRFKGLGTLALIAVGVSLTPSTASAQVDVRLIRPNVMVLFDDSGSMEWRNTTNNSLCGTSIEGGVCNQCSNGASICSSLCPEPERRNRWTTALEVFTGTIQNFSCLEAPRNDPTAYDYVVNVPHHQPLSNGVPLFRPGAAQTNDGIFDTYADRVRFGLMTFDSDPRTGIEQHDGLYSYGTDQNFRPNGCPTSTRVNLGARRASRDNNVSDVVPGSLISVGDPALDGAGLSLNNQRIQQSLVGRPVSGMIPEVPGLRPWGGTPIAPLLADSLYYWSNDHDVTDGSSGGAGDPYYQCRKRANILITDGAPNLDMRPSCEGGECPYPTASTTAATLALPSPGGANVRTYVIGFNALDPTAVSALTPIAVAGNTSRVYWANDRPTLAAALSEVLDTISSFSSTRTPPVFGEASSVTSTSMGRDQYRFSASFNINPGDPWTGTLQRYRTVCSTSTGVLAATPQTFDPAAGDDFSYNLQPARRAAVGAPGQRYLWTFQPTGATSQAQMTGSIVSATTAGVGTQIELNSSIVPGLFNYTTTSEVNNLLAWLRGDAGSVREDHQLGDIFHSIPTYVPAPEVNLADQTFTAYRQHLLRSGDGRRRDTRYVGTREPMMYVGTNDGILHAFNIDNGEEVWGFVPPAQVPMLRSAYPSTHRFGVDGTPVVKEIVFERSSTALNNDSDWHTVVVVGMRQGGPHYVALDVTDPYNPRFLWQFTDPDMADSYATPAIGTLFFTPPSPIGHGEVVERAVAFLPGGEGPSAACAAPGQTRPVRSHASTFASSGWTDRRGQRRNNTRCWSGRTGQFFYVVDLATGNLVRKLGTGGGVSPTIDLNGTGAPMVGTPALHNGASGTVVNRAYLGDANGTLWRADFSSNNPANWWMADIYDMFWDSTTYDAGQPIVERPVITTDVSGRTLIAFATGNPDLLESVEENRVAAIVEETTADAAGTVSAITINASWEIHAGSMTATRDFYNGERLTGPMTLFNNVLYFGTFVPRTSTNPCEIGFARLWGIDMYQTDASDQPYTPRARLDLDGDDSTTSDIVRMTADLNRDGSTVDDANSVLFGVTAQRELVCSQTSTTTDPTTGVSRSYVSSSTPGNYYLHLQTGSGSTGVGTIRTITPRRLPTPRVPARIDSWATVFE